MATREVVDNEKIANIDTTPSTSQGQTSEVRIPPKYLSEVHELLTKAKMGKFKQVWSVLDARQHYINCVPENRAFGVLHQAVFWGIEEVVLKVLSYPTCDPFIQTNQDKENNYGPGKTSDLLAKNKKIKDIITEAQERYKFAKDNKSRLLARNSDYRTMDELKIQEIGECLSGEDCDWERVTKSLKIYTHLINTVDPITGLTPLHEAVVAEKLNVISLLLEFPFSNPAIETIDTPMNRYGPGKTAQQVTDSGKLIGLIIDRKEAINRLFLTPPTRILPWRVGVLRIFFFKVLKEYQSILCPPDLIANQDLELTFVLREIFAHINTENNWLLAKQEVTYQLRNIGYEYSQLLDEYSVMNEEKSGFFAKLIQIYTKEEEKAFYPELNELFLSLQRGKDIQTNLELGVYALLLNTLLMYWGDGIQAFTGTTYRGVILTPQDVTELVKDYEFVSLNFMSCSRREDSPKYEQAECMFVIDNSAKCLWSPKLIGKFSAKADETEYLYPCGARFKVVSSAPNYINMKLIPPQ